MLHNYTNSSEAKQLHGYSFPVAHVTEGSLSVRVIAVPEVPPEIASTGRQNQQILFYLPLCFVNHCA